MVCLSYELKRYNRTHWTLEVAGSSPAIPCITSILKQASQKHAQINVVVGRPVRLFIYSPGGLRYRINDASWHRYHHYCPQAGTGRKSKRPYRKKEAINRLRKKISCCVQNYAVVAQSEERLPSKQEVAGSSPAIGEEFFFVFLPMSSFSLGWNIHKSLNSETFCFLEF